MLEFQLFRIKVYPSGQMRIDGPQEPSEILLETIKSLPSAELWKGMTWHLGNICEIDENGLYFRVGRTTKARREIYQGGNFTDEEFEEAPYTHVVLDIPTEVCAIAKKPKLSPSPKGIANRLVSLFSGSDIARYCSANFEIDGLMDPEDLITHLSRAYVISKFSMTFSRPNPFDADEDFVRPFSKLISEAQGEKGKAQIEGENLKPQLLENLARSAAATGNDAMARLQIDKKQKPTTIHLHKNPVFVQHEDVSESEQKMSLLDNVRRVYRQVRGKPNSD